MNSDTYRRYQHYFSLFVYGFLLTTIGPHLPVIAAQFKISMKSAALVNTFLSFGFLGGVIAAGRLLKWPKLSGISTMSIMTLSGLLAFFVESPIFFYMAYVGMGIAGGAMEINSNTSIVKYGRERSGLFLNILHFYFGIGALTGPVVASWLISVGMWKYSYLIVAVVSASVALGMTRMQCDNDKSLRTFGWVKLFRHPVFIAGGIMVTAYIGFEMSINSWLVTFLEKKNTFSMERASQALSVFWIMMTIGRVFFGYLTIRIGRLYLLVVSVVFAGILFVAFVRFSDTVLLDWLFVAGIGFFMSSMMPLIVSILNDHSPVPEKDANVYIMVFMGLGVMVFPYLIGIISETYSLKDSLSGLIVLPVLLFILSFTLKRK